ncbi:MAG: cytochrome c oxidase assembly protein [Rudaea sp.]|uniref:cytochrome c oxidase assembly protein n=1 Tax=unclassified Rudaea TaxID=2627037 RepID=UPI0010F47886|nr:MULTISPECIES: cytochrome c oxidase assembly protein [unclassified Rudaea]MBN8887007.1 cytochrome c oxidase assembly protein [Rudaea sp.]
MSNTNESQSESQKKNWRVIKIGLIVCVASFLFGFRVMPPIYRIACEHIFGIKFENKVADGAKVAGFAPDMERTVEVQFVGNVNSALSWKFAPEVFSVKVHPGVLTEAWFDASNLAPEAIVGNAVPSIAPNRASLYFNKTECFCFTEQMLKAGESRRMPVRFVVDPKLPADIKQLTLSYTFYNNELATKRLAAQEASTQPKS